jgi:branched-chain amino acid transport system substrate-binding protein
MRDRKCAICLLVTVIFTVMLLLQGFAGPVSAQTKTLKIGMVHHLGFSLGRDAQKLLEAYVPYLNEKGGVQIGGEKYKIELIVYDTKFSAELGRSAVERLINQDKVKFILGDITADAWLPITEANAVVAVVGTNSPAIYRPDLKYAFQASALATMPVSTFGWFTKNYPKMTSIGLICTNDLKGQNDVKQLTALSAVFGTTMKDTIMYPPDQTDFSAIGTRMKAANPEMVSLAGGGLLQDSLALKALRQAGWKGTLVNYRGLIPEQYKKVVPLDQLEGAIFPVEGIQMADPRPIGKELIDAYVAKNGKWDSPAAYSVGGFYMLLAAMKQAQSIDTNKVAAAIANGLKFDSPQGPVLMISRPDMGNNRTVESLYETYIHTVEKGKVKLLATVSVEEGLGYINKTGVFKAK